MAKMWAVPMLALVKAESENEAYEQVNLKVQNRLLGEVPMLIDEGEDAFAYDDEVCEVLSINDRAEAARSLQLTALLNGR